MKLITSITLLIVCLAYSSNTQAMDTLFVVHFEVGPSWDPSLAPNDQAGFSAHSSNLNRLRQEGVIVFGARYGELGMIVVRADSLASVNALINDDPGVRAGIFTYRVDALNVFYSWQDTMS